MRVSTVDAACGRRVSTVDAACGRRLSAQHLPHGVGEHGHLLLEVGHGVCDLHAAVQQLHRLRVGIVAQLERARYRLGESSETRELRWVHDKR